MSRWTIALLSFLVGAAACWVVTRLALSRAPERLTRTNVNGRMVPAVLGWGVTAGILAGHVAWAIGEHFHQRMRECIVAPGLGCLDFIVYPTPFFVGLAVLIVGMFAVGAWDDLKGDERPRGFKGHLGELKRGRLTGGMVKLLGGSAAALGAAYLIDDARDLLLVVLQAACIALTANLVNLLDRAPGRSLKVFLPVAVSLVGFSLFAGNPRVLSTAVVTLFAGAIGATLVALPADLKARGMLGDAGANPLGALLGLGLTVELWRSAWGLTAIVAVLLVLNLASEKWSFSEIIAANRVLARWDQLGRK